ncbi:hypothetical protein G7Y89_g4248 [Cudoniella acicularis]|uniref:O-methyltransferase domain-containing protein n=1 Tax=Cudoniella acicularis TaxID=354080 RepID=A0A8H4RQN0_9HELO|nr:hypothetical protein G7Y89_g4248 [Cudoniella acicularis]
MENRLQRLNEELEDILFELNTKYSSDLQAAHVVSRTVEDLPPQSIELNKSIELVSELQNVLIPPLHKVVDGIFGNTPQLPRPLFITRLILFSRSLPTGHALPSSELQTIGSCLLFIAFTTSKALASAVHYKIPDLLNQHGRLSAIALAKLTTPPTEPGALLQLLRLLANSVGIFEYDPEDETFSNNPASSLLATDHWTRWHLWAHLYPTAFYDIFANLENSISESEPQTATQIQYKAEATEPFYALLSRLPWARQFFETIGAGSTAMAPGMLADYPWTEVNEGPVCDIGGGNGEFLFTLLQANEKMTGAILELKGSVAMKAATDNFAAAGESEGEQTGGKFAAVNQRVFSVHAGDFFVEVPPYPVYTIRWTLHNWGEEQSELILRNIRSAIQKARKPNSRLLIIESVVTDSRMGRPAMYGSVIMMAGSKGGKERTEKEWRQLCARTRWTVHGIHVLKNCIPCILDLRPTDE